MTRLIKFVRSQFPGSPDWLNPDHIRIINFDGDYASIETTGDKDIIVTFAEAHRLIAEINGTQAETSAAANQRFNAALPPSDTRQAVEDALAEDAAWFPERAHFRAPDQPDTSLAAFKAMLQLGDYVVLDTETTGLDDGEIVQIAIVNSDGLVLLDTLVKPKRPIPMDATRIHGITNDMVANAPTWEFVRDQVYNCLLGRHVVIYNAVYDRKMMHKSSERWGLTKTEWKDIAAFWCAMEAFAEIYGDWNDYRQSYRWQKLSTAAAHYGIEQTDAHTALADCLTTLAVCKAMAGA